MEGSTLTIDGRAVSGSQSFPVENPATLEIVGDAPACTPTQLDQAMSAAARAFDGWSRSMESRRTFLAEMADALDARAADLAAVLTLEQGKPLADSTIELAHCALWLRYFAKLEVAGTTVVRESQRSYASVSRQPIGVVAAIAPWNFPLTLAVWKIAPALLAGNTMVLKPSPYTPLSTLMLGEVCRGVLPPGVLNVVSGPDPLGAWMTAHPTPRKISFTGSTSTGRLVAASAASTFKRTTLELGGNDPAIVMADADVAAIAKKLFWAGFQNNGQVCLAAKRVYAHDSVHDDLVDALGDMAKSVQVGDGRLAGVQLGPINNRPQLERVAGLVDDARRAGARIAYGGERISGSGYFYQPTILADAEDGMALVDEEQFGPALPVVRFRELDDVITRANALPYGLTASVWSSDVEVAYAIASRLDAGQVTINSHGTAAGPDLPFGGHKQSGVGVENGPWGLEEYQQLHVLSGPGRT